MAELDVQPKKKSVLPWILIGLIVLAILAFFLLRYTDLGEDITDQSIFTDSTEQQVDTVNRGMDTTRMMPADTTTLR